MLFSNHLLAVFGTLLVLSGTAWSKDSFREPSIVKPGGLDSIGLNVVAGVGACIGLFVLGVMVYAIYSALTKSRRSGFSLPRTPAH